MDNLSKDMIACKEAGFGVHYGKWKATQPVKTTKIKAEEPAPNPVVVKPVVTKRRCAQCNKEFVSKQRRRMFCSNKCSSLAYYYKNRKLKCYEDKKGKAKK